MKIQSWRYDLENWDKLNRLLQPYQSIAKTAAASYAGSDLPDEVDFRPNIKIENQFSIGSCQGNSISTSVEIIVFVDTGTIIQLTRMGAYIWSQEIDGLTGDVGSCVGSGVEVAMKGLCLERFWMYPRSYSRTPPNGSREEAERNRTIRILKFYPLKTVEDVKVWTESRQGPIHCGFNWVSSLNSAGAVVESYSGAGGGGHSVTLAGYKLHRGDRIPRLFNSWSESYGDRGTTLLTYRAIEQALRDRFTVMIGVASSVGILPPKYDYLSKPVTR